MIGVLLKNASPWVESASVPQIAEGFDRPLKESDFQLYRETCETNLENILTAFESNAIESDETTESEKLSQIVSLVVLCGEHSSSNLWTTENSVKLADRILKTFLSKYGGNVKLENLLTTNRGKIFKNLLNYMRPYLLKETWKNNPSKVVSFSWILKFIKSPHLEDHHMYVFPTVLIITDDFQSNYRIMGLHLIQHILDNVTRAQLEYYNHETVLVEAMKPMLYDNNIEVIPSLIKTYADLLKKFSPPLPFVELNRNQFDDIFQILLQNMFLQQQNAVKNAYIQEIPKYIKARGLGTIRHSELLFQVLGEYALSSDTAVPAMEALIESVKVCWPRKNWIFDRVSRIVVKLIYAYSNDPTTHPIGTLQTLKSLCGILCRACPDNTKLLIHDVQKENITPQFSSAFDEILCSEYKKIEI